MKFKNYLLIIIVVIGVLAILHITYLYFTVYGDVIHAQLTPRQWVKMYGIDCILIAILSITLEIVSENR